MHQYFDDLLTLDELIINVIKGWNEVTLQEGKLNQVQIYRASLGLEESSEYELCDLHRSSMDKKDPSVCVKCDPVDTSSKNLTWVHVLISFLVMLIVIAMWVCVEMKKRASDAAWLIDKKACYTSYCDHLPLSFFSV